MSNIRIAAHLITWGADWRQGLQDLQEFGFRGVEPRAFVAREWAGRSAEFAALLAAHELELAALYADCKLLDPMTALSDLEGARQTARFVHALGARRLIVGGGARRAGGNRPEDWALLVNTLHEIGRFCQELGLLACYHPHLGTMVESAAEIDRLMDLTNPNLVSLTVDCAHMYKGGAVPHEVVRRYGSRVGHVHIKDLTPEGDWSSDTDRLPIFTELGQGVIDLKALADALRDVSYNGWITVELDRSLIGPRESLRINKAYLEQELGLNV